MTPTNDYFPFSHTNRIGGIPIRLQGSKVREKKVKSQTSKILIKCTFTCINCYSDKKYLIIENIQPSRIYIYYVQLLRGNEGTLRKYMYTY